MKTKILLLSCAILAGAVSGCVTGPDLSSWTARFEILPANLSASLRGLSCVSRDVVWVSGGGGTVARTVDGGETWTRVDPPGSGEAEIRDVQAFSADVAVVLSCTEPGRILRTEDGGESWEVVYENLEDGVFLDGMAFYSDGRGVVMGDPLGGTFLVLRTEDGGRSFSPVAADGIPAAVEGEAGFAASGTNVAVAGERRAFIATGGAAARLLRSDDAGKTWRAFETPMLSGRPPTGIFSVAFWNERDGVAVGGDYEVPEGRSSHWARTSDGGETWEAGGEPGPRGYRSCVAAHPTAAGPTLVTVGPSGADVSFDGGRTWRVLGDLGFHVVGFAPDGAAFAAGAEGRVARLLWTRPTD